MVPQRCGGVRALPPRTGIRARIKFATDFVSARGISNPLLICYSAELELTVSLLVQIDKLVMLIESPIFTSTHTPYEWYDS